MPGFSYRDNQFYNIANAGEEGTAVNGVWSPANDTQAKFDHHTSVVRYTAVKNAPATSHKLQRGYMRSILPGNSFDAAGQPIDVPLSVCNFQFNPQTIRQNVQQNPQVTHFVMQPPEQFAQPMASNVNFQFDLFFDRSAELNSYNPLSAEAVNTTAPWDKNGPDQVGVLHDLSRLFSVIGQGVSIDQLQYAQSVLIDQYNRDPLTTTNVAEDGTETISTTPADAGGVNDVLNANLGNIGFLLPIPVRVVFSSLYIVEGLVSSCEVQFTKFTHTMVPMHCMVSILMEAKYIGFAKKDTFFSWALEKRAQTEGEKAEQTRNFLETISPTVLSDLTYFRAYLSPTQENRAKVARMRDYPSDAEEGLADNGDDRYLKGFFRNANVSVTRSDTSALALFEDERDFSISVDNLLCYFVYFSQDLIDLYEESHPTRESDPTAFVRWLMSQDNDNVIDNSSSDPFPPPPAEVPSDKGVILHSTYLQGDNTKRTTAGSKDEWIDMVTLHSTGSKVTNSSDISLSSTDDYYYLVYFEGSATLTYEGNTLSAPLSADYCYTMASSTGIDWDNTTTFLGGYSPTFLESDTSSTRIYHELRWAWPNIIETPVVI